jgi:hypothetical protein
MIHSGDSCAVKWYKPHILHPKNLEKLTEAIQVFYKNIYLYFFPITDILFNYSVTWIKLGKAQPICDRNSTESRESNSFCVEYNSLLDYLSF